MLLALLLRPSLCCPQAAPLSLTRCVRTLRCDASRSLLPSQAEHLLRRRLPPRLHTQSRGAKSRGRKSRSQEEEWRTRNKTVLTYIAAAGVGMIGLSYAAVPLYRLYCQASGLGGTAVAGHDVDQVETMKPVKERVLKITFNADTHASMQWNFRPQQTEIYVVPGETALAFYRAKNPTNKPIIGISTYNVVPFEAGQYFNKIQVVWFLYCYIILLYIILIIICH
ncbi:cytochrome c oxidase assembly protein COX11, mitochondrial-like, partial [Plectropomus leopardus]|uniref:cytochrome c oxidase assembly protein COX11, mitochondrial-like n=1 Tax=Plectropomus leopardus TaxID=160734 RepID=UPI001C4C5EA2